LNEILKRLEAYLKENRRVYFDGLDSGICEEGKSKFERQFNFKVPDELSKLLMWRNGKKDAFNGAFQFNMSLMSLDEIIESKKLTDKLLDEGHFDVENWWSKSWIPFMCNGAGSNVCIDIEGSFGGVKGQVIEFWCNDFDRTISYPSLTAFFNTYVTALEFGYFELETYGGWDIKECKYDEWEKLKSEFNPGYPKYNYLE